MSSKIFPRVSAYFRRNSFSDRKMLPSMRVFRFSDPSCPNLLWRPTFRQTMAGASESFRRTTFATSPAAVTAALGVRGECLWLADVRALSTSHKVANRCMYGVVPSHTEACAGRQTSLPEAPIGWLCIKSWKWLCRSHTLNW